MKVDFLVCGVMPAVEWAEVVLVYSTGIIIRFTGALLSCFIYKSGQCYF